MENLTPYFLCPESGKGLLGSQEKLGTLARKYIVFLYEKAAMDSHIPKGMGEGLPQASVGGLALRLLGG